MPEASRTARGQHVANLLAFQPDERIQSVIQIKTYEDAPYLVLATRNGLVKKSKLTDFDSNRSGGIVAINLRGEDELVGAVLCSAEDDLLLVSAQGQSIPLLGHRRGTASMGRATSGVQGMRFNGDDELLSLNVVREERSSWSPRRAVTPSEPAWRTTRCRVAGGKGVLTIQYDKKRGTLSVALIVATTTSCTRSPRRRRHQDGCQAGS